MPALAVNMFPRMEALAFEGAVSVSVKLPRGNYLPDTTLSLYQKTEEVALKRSYTYDEERQVTKPTSPLQSCRSRIGFRHSRSRSRAVAPDTILSSCF